jgi:hypothetical protein
MNSFIICTFYEIRSNHLVKIRWVTHVGLLRNGKMIRLKTVYEERLFEYVEY